MTSLRDQGFPEWLDNALEREGGLVNRSEALGRLSAAGVAEIGWLGFAGNPDSLTAKGPGVDVFVDVTDETTPVTTALNELVTFLQDFGALRQLHAADQDMDHVAYAARELAKTLDRERGVSYLHTLAEVVETGLVTMYARNFTRKARLGDSWLPPAGESRDLHFWIIGLRHTVYAHADWTPSRTIVDTNAMLGLEGRPS